MFLSPKIENILGYMARVVSGKPLLICAGRRCAITCKMSFTEESFTWNFHVNQELERLCLGRLKRAIQQLALIGDSDLNRITSVEQVLLPSVLEFILFTTRISHCLIIH